MNACFKDSLSRYYDLPLSVGYSGVLFGFITLYPRENIYGYECKKEHYPFILLLAMQLMFERTSFIGHLIGIASAYLLIGIRDMKD